MDRDFSTLPEHNDDDLIVSIPVSPPPPAPFNDRPRGIEIPAGPAPDSTRRLVAWIALVAIAGVGVVSVVLQLNR